MQGKCNIKPNIYIQRRVNITCTKQNPCMRPSFNKIISLLTLVHACGTGIRTYSPSEGSTAGGTALTIWGSNFQDTDLEVLVAGKDNGFSAKD